MIHCGGGLAGARSPPEAGRDNGRLLPRGLGFRQHFLAGTRLPPEAGRDGWLLPRGPGTRMHLLAGARRPPEAVGKVTPAVTIRVSADIPISVNIPTSQGTIPYFACTAKEEPRRVMPLRNVVTTLYLPCLQSVTAAPYNPFHLNPFMALGTRHRETKEHERA